MANILLESDFPTMDLRTLLSQQADNSDDVGGLEPDAAAINDTESDLPSTGTWGKPWEDLLEQRLKQNSVLTKNKKTDYEVEAVFFKDFFEVQWGTALAQLLLDIGEPLRKVFKVLKFDPTRNPILGFLVQDFAINLIKAKKLNVSTFKAIYNAVAKRLMAESEFMQKNDYNILYCNDLYNKSADEIEKYLSFQNRILKTSASEAYSDETKNKNKLVFLKTGHIAEQDPTRRAKMLNKEKTLPSDIADVENCSLNSLELAKLILENSGAETIQISNKEAQELVLKVGSHPARVYAAIMSLSLSTKSKQALKALKNPIFSGLTMEQVTAATVTIANNGIIPKGQLSEKDADALVDTLLANMAH